MTSLRTAIDRRDWDLAALYLLLGVARVVAVLPEGAASDLLALLEAGERRGSGR
jgi:hypothetical protein